MQSIAADCFIKLSLDQHDRCPSPAEPVIDSTDVHIVDLQQFTPLGGVFYFDLFQMPPQSRTVKGWEIREVHFENRILGIIENKIHYS